MANYRYLDDSTEKFKHLNKVLKSGFDLASATAEDMNDDADVVTELREVMIKYAAMERDLKNTLKACEESRKLYEKSIQNNKNDDEVDFFGLFEEKLAALESKNTDEELEDNKRVKAYDATIMKQLAGGDHEEETPQSECDEEIQMTQPDRSQKFICPITKVEMVKPVKNVCGHTYSRKAIEEHLRNNKNRKARCPVAGCVHFVTSGDLVDDEILAYEIRQSHK